MEIAILTQPNIYKSEDKKKIEIYSTNAHIELIELESPVMSIAVMPGI